MLFVRNGAIENTVLIETKGWREELRLGAGEERTIQVPANQAAGATWLRVTTANGFTPSRADSQSRDTRHLGVFGQVGAGAEDEQRSITNYQLPKSKSNFVALRLEVGSWRLEVDSGRQNRTTPPTYGPLIWSSPSSVSTL